MFDKLISKLKKERHQLQKTVDEHVPEYIEEKPSFDITIVKENNLFKMEISDYISIVDYVERTNLIDKFGVRDMISNGVLWNSGKQQVNKGTYYVLVIDNRLYNILINGDYLAIDERTKKDDITEERIIDFNISSNSYNYFSAKHDKTGDTFYTKYYSKPEFDFGKLNLSKDEAYEGINKVITNLANIEEITGIIDVNLLKTHILNDICAASLQSKKTL